MCEKMKKIIAIGFCSLFILSNCMSVFADEAVTSETITYDSTVEGSDPTQIQDVSVGVEMAETYSVVLPKSITMDGSDQLSTFDYTINVSGEIGDDNYVRVIPLDGAYVTNGSAQLPITITQNTRRFNAEECHNGTEANGSMTIMNLYPGKWAGSVRFKILLDDGAIWSSATCTQPATRVGEDTNDDGVITDDEKDSELGLGTVTRGTALGHSFADGDTSFPATCLTCSKPVYGISTADQFCTFRDNVNGGNAYTGATIELLSDIDLSGVTWTPINGFAGNFDGHNHKIINMKITNLIGCRGLFDNLGDTKVENLILQSPTITGEYTQNGGTNYVGCVVGMARGTILNNVHIRDMVINVSGKCVWNVGGIVGTKDSGYTFTANNVSVTGAMATTATSSSYAANLSGIGIGGVINNSFTSVSMVTSSANSMTPFGFGATVTNCVYDNTVCTVSITGNGMDTAQADSGMSTDAIKNTTEAIDILNTDNTDYVWELDVEGINNGYPVIR